MGRYRVPPMFESLLNGEIGSPREGPGLGQRAPEFRLPRSDRQGEIALTPHRNGRPCVLVFGLFT
jgi:hypothetical protein